MPEAKPKSLVEKLAEACDAVGGIAKKGKNTQQNYSYVKAADVAKAIRHELFKRGVLVIPDEQSIDWAEVAFKSGTVMRECRLKTNYRITDGITEIIVGAFGVAMDSGDKAIYKAKTGAQKYFLRGLGLIPDEKDDPEADESVDKATKGESTEEFDQRTEGQKRVAQFQVNEFLARCKKTGKTDLQLIAYLKELGGYRQVEEMSRDQFPDALKWATAPIAAGKKHDLTEKLAESVELIELHKAMKRVWALAAEKSLPEADVKTWAHETFKVDSMKSLTLPQLRSVAEWISST